MVLNTDLQSVVDSLEKYKRMLGRRFASSFWYQHRLEIVADYNKLENEIAFMVDTFGLTRKSEPYKLSLDRI